MSRVKVVTFVPIESADKVRRALGVAGAGKIGEYSFCSYSVVGKGRFVPGANASPHIGEPGKSEVVEEERIEVVCEREDAKNVIAAMKETHPYEEVAFDIYPLFDEEDL
ncbi:hypothetical protein RAAC3_TM7C00001G0015 [Candidatus Saccharibacteria bacterium RAAC3_TM7_1]|nr:hypothetical protein RAAC3_TM7C00001G0015 [Candidatus Saccharibacteria bacterium RAAC3_TM7_1]HCZ28810.1 hypothetical protein [Candidatus Saccharibacteria bacterium]